MKTSPKHAALVRDDNNNLQVRRFETAADAARAAATLEAPLISVEVKPAPAPERMLDHKTFAKRIWCTSKLVRSLYRRGGLPGSIAHSDRLILVPAKFVHLARVHGLVGLERMARAGMLKEGGA